MGGPTPTVAILMGSDSDLPTMAECARVLEGYEVPYDIRVLSAHRSPEEAAAYAREAADRGLRVIIAGAGGAAHLAGAMAAHTTLPVIGVPLDSSPLGGFDALLATVQMPPGVPVGTLGVGAWGARNAAHLAIRILALADQGLAQRMEARMQAAKEAVLRDAPSTPRVTQEGSRAPRPAPRAREKR